MKLKKIISLLVSAATAFSAFGFSALADDAAYTKTVEDGEITTYNTTVSDDGKTVTFSGTTNNEAAVIRPVTSTAGFKAEGSSYAGAEADYVVIHTDIVSSDTTNTRAGFVYQGVDSEGAAAASNTRVTVNTAVADAAGESLDVIVDIANKTAYFYENGVYSLVKEYTLTSDTMARLLRFELYYNAGTVTFGDITFTSYLGEVTFDDVVSETFEKTYVKNTVDGTIGAYNANATVTKENGVITGVFDAGEGIFIKGNDNYCLPGTTYGGTAADYVVMHAEIVSSDTSSSKGAIFHKQPDNSANARDYSTGTVGCDAVGVMDIIVDMAEHTAYFYENGALTATASITASNEFTRLQRIEIFYNAGTVTYKNPTVTTYTGKLTLTEVKADTLKTVANTGISIEGAGMTEVAAESTDTYTVYQNSGSASQPFIYLKPSAAFALGTQTADLYSKYMHIRTKLKVLEDNGLDTYIRLAAANGGNQSINANAGKLLVKDDEPYTVDFIVDADTKTLYTYIDGVLKSPINGSATAATSTGGVKFGFVGATEFTEKLAVYDSETTCTLYANTKSLSDILFDMTDNVIAEEYSKNHADEASYPDAFSTWGSKTVSYDASNDIITVTRTADVENNNVRFAPLKLEMDLSSSSAAGIYHFTTYWNVKEVTGNPAWIFVVGSSNKYTGDSLGINLPYKFEKQPVKGGIYRFDVIIDANTDPSKPVVYIYRNGEKILGSTENEISAIVSESADKTFGACVRMGANLSADAMEFRDTHAIIYKKGYKTLADIEAEIAKAEWVTVEDITVTADEATGKSIVSAEIAGNVPSDATVILSGRNSDSAMSFAALGSAELDTTALSAVKSLKAFVWKLDTMLPLATAYSETVE